MKRLDRRAARQEGARAREREAEASGFSPIEREHLRGYHGRCSQWWGDLAPCGVSS